VPPPTGDLCLHDLPHDLHHALAQYIRMLTSDPSLPLSGHTVRTGHRGVSSTLVTDGPDHSVRNHGHQQRDGIPRELLSVPAGGLRTD
jgi:hypothetical protein